MPDAQHVTLNRSSLDHRRWAWRHRGQLTVLLSGFFSVCCCIGSGCQRESQLRPPQASATARPLAVNTMVARRQPSMEIERSFTGLVQARRSSLLGFERAGRLARMLVQEGDQVEAGTDLAQLDIQQLEQQRASLNLALEGARQTLGPMEAEDSESTPVTRRARIQQLRAELDQLERESASEPPGVASRLRDVEQRVDRLNEATRGETRQATKARIAELESRLGDVQREISAGTLTAPYDGVVLLRQAREGTVVSAGMPILELVEQDQLETRIGVPPDVAEDIQTGQSLSLVVGTKAIEGTVDSILPRVERTGRTRTLIMSLNSSPTEKIFPGEIAELRLVVRQPTAGFWVPITALTRPLQQSWTVYVLEESSDTVTVARRRVDILTETTEQAFVQGELETGDRLIVDGLHRVVPGQRVKPDEAGVSSESPDATSRPDA